MLCETEQRLKVAGVNLEDLHVEPAPGQFEINFEPAWGILGRSTIFCLAQVRVPQLTITINMCDVQCARCAIVNNWLVVLPHDKFSFLRII